MGVLITGPTPKMLKLRALTERYANESDLPCEWCKRVQAGDHTSTAIPKPSASMCLEHRALSVRWSRWFATARWNAPSVLPEIVTEGVEIAERQGKQAA